MTNTINRRKALIVVAAAPAAVALGAVPGRADGAGGELAALVKRYFEETAYFNATGEDSVTGEWRSDEEADALAGVTFDKTVVEMIGVPARTKQDALAALEFMEREDMIESWHGPTEGLSGSLVAAIRGYIEGRA